MLFLLYYIPRYDSERIEIIEIQKMILKSAYKFLDSGVIKSYSKCPKEKNMNYVEKRLYMISQCQLNFMIAIFIIYKV